MPDPGRNTFQAQDGVVYPFGVAAAGLIKYIDTDVTLTGVLVNQFTAPLDPGVRYDIEAQLYLNMSGAGIVTTSLGVTGLTPTIRCLQLAEATAATALQSSAGVGDRVIASGSISTGVHSIIVRGGISASVSPSTIFLAMSTAGAGLLVVGSTFRVFRAQ